MSQMMQMLERDAASKTTAQEPQAEPPAWEATWESRLSLVFWVNSVAISDDATRIIGATYLHDYMQPGGSSVPNVQSRFETRCLDSDKKTLWSDPYDGWNGIYGVAISGDGKVAAAGGWLSRNAPPDTTNTRGLLRAYNADNKDVLLEHTGIPGRVSIVSLSKDGRVLAAAADDVYVFLREGEKFNPKPLQLGISEIANKKVTAVAVDNSGTWLAACDKSGHVYVAAIEAGKLRPLLTWQAEEVQPEVPFLSIAIARNGNRFVVGGGNSVYIFDIAPILKGERPAPIHYAYDDPDTPKTMQDGKTIENIRWVAISGDGKLVTAVANRLHVQLTADNKRTETRRGRLLALTPEAPDLLAWSRDLDNNPNSTSIDDKAKYVTAADGFPTGKPAKFYLFNGNGDKVRRDFVTYNMNWPMVVNANGTAIAAGSDDGTIYYFKL